VKASGVLKVVIATCAISVIATHLSPATAAPAAQVVTCVDLSSSKERISKTDTCRATEATAKWHLAPTDSALASGGTTKSLTICSNKESSPVAYQRIRTSCYKHMQTNFYTRSAALPSKPVITQVSSTSYESASLTLARNPAANVDAPIAYYTITSSKGDVKKINSWRELTVTVSGLKSATSYTFTITATSVDGVSPVSASSLPVTTQVYVAPVAAATTAPLAAPAFTLSASAETKTVNTAITGYTITSTGGTIASYTISPAAPAGTTFNTSTGLITGTPTATQSAIAYTITATNASGSATATFTLTIQPLGAPAFTLSSIAETKTVNSGISGYSITSTGGEIVSYTITPTAPAGITFSTSTGLLSGTPTSTQGATTYTITATNASGSASATFTLRVAPSAPSFTVSSTSETRVATTLLVGYTIDASAGATVASYSLVGTLPAGLSFSTSNGRITGTPTETKTATTYTIIGTSASGETATATYRLRVTGDVGDTGPGGGIIYFVSNESFTCGPTLASSCNYLEVAPSGWNTGSDPKVFSELGSSDVITNDAVAYNNLLGVGLGYKNSLAIVAQNGAGTTYAAGVARAYAGGSKSDWYLPTTAELNLLCQWARGVAPSVITGCIGGTLNSATYGAGTAGFASGGYWSSSEYDASNAWYPNFANGFQNYGGKNNALFVRPVRAF
jgi:hypothetical protein